jgi:hypothetical protein
MLFLVIFRASGIAGMSIDPVFISWNHPEIVHTEKDKVNEIKRKSMTELLRTEQVVKAFGGWLLLMVWIWHR